MSTWTKGKQAEKLEKEYWENQGYLCRTFPKVRFNQQDFFGADVVCVNKAAWILIQVKSRQNRLPSFDQKTIDKILSIKRKTPMDTKLFWVGYRMDTKQIRRIKI